MVANEQPDLPADIDARLWIRTAGCDSPDYLFGNPHTFRGRMHAYCPHRNQDFAVSQDEVIESSSEASIWIDGYLIGNEAGPTEP